MWWVIALLFGGFVLGWIASEADFEQVLDLFTVLRECIRNSGHHVAVNAQIAPDPLDALDQPVGSITAKTV